MSMHNEKLVTCIKVAGKVLREQKDQVFIPFGSEYSIYIKNLNSVRALVRISLDNVDVTDGNDLVVGPNSSIDLERFMKKGNLSQGNRFKFIERTGKIEAHRGIQAEDGLLRVEFQFEKVAPKVETIVTKTIHHHEYYDHYHPWSYRGGCFGGPYYNYSTNYLLGGGENNIGSAIGSAGLMSNTLGDSSSFAEPDSTVACSATSGSLASSTVGMSFNAGGGVASASNCASPQGAGVKGLLRSAGMKGLLHNANVNFSAPVMDSAPVNDAGITVPGSLSNQSFTLVSSFPVEDEKHVIILKLLGETGKGKAVKQAVTVKHAQTCSTCGTRNRGKLAQFCRDCGTALEVA